MTDQPRDRSKAHDDAPSSGFEKNARELKRAARGSAASASDSDQSDTSAKTNAALCWPFPAGSQNDTDKAVQLKPYVPPKRRTLNQY